MTVYLVGAGPGAADLLTIRAARLLGEADVVVRDRLIDDSVMSYVNPDAKVYFAGKEPGDSSSQESINELLILLSQNHETIVRLKGGDPFVFGRGGEELIALHEAGIRCDVVPGVTSALSGPMAAGIPVTHRGISRGFTVVTGTGSDGEATNFTQFAKIDTTLIILMGIKHRETIAKELIAGGLDATTPVAVIERAWTETQRTVRGDLLSLANLDVSNPAIIVVGEVATLNLRDFAFSDVVLI
jgi:uroporphyrin-III C-methyltransferase